MTRPLDALHVPHPVANAPCSKLVKQSAVPERFKESTQKLRIESMSLVTIFSRVMRNKWLQKLKYRLNNKQLLMLWRKERDLSPPGADGESGKEMGCTHHNGKIEKKNFLLA